MSNFIFFHNVFHAIFILKSFNPLLDDKILDWSKLKEFADDNFKFDENSRKFFKQVENTVGKGESARYEHFLLFPQCFQKACFPGSSKGVIVWEWVNSYISVVVCIFFEFGTVYKWRIREWVTKGQNFFKLHNVIRNDKVTVTQMIKF